MRKSKASKTFRSLCLSCVPLYPLTTSPCVASSSVSTNMMTLATSLTLRSDMLPRAMHSAMALIMTGPLRPQPTLNPFTSYFTLPPQWDGSSTNSTSRQPSSMATCLMRRLPTWNSPLVLRSQAKMIGSGS